MDYRIIESLRLAQQLYPMLRVGQIMCNAAALAGWTEKDIFYCEDDTLYKGLRLLIERAH